MKLDKGYSRPNLNNMRKFYLLYPICQTLSDKLSRSHIGEQITIFVVLCSFDFKVFCKGSVLHGKRWS